MLKLGVFVVGSLFWVNLWAQDWVAPESNKDVLNPFVENIIATKKGEALFGKLCWTCHGKTGGGDGPAAAGLRPKPENLSLAIVQEQKDGELFWKISNGNGMMAPYKHSLTERQIWELVNYIRTFKN